VDQGKKMPSPRIDLPPGANGNVSSLSLWFVLALVLVKTRFDSYLLSVLGFVCLFSVSFVLLERVFRIVSIAGRPVRHAPAAILARALTGGAAVSLAVTLGKIGGPLWGGIFSTFPAMFISAMVITHVAQGAAFSAGVMKSSLVSSATVVIHAVIVRLVYLPLGLWVGTSIALAVSFGSGWAIYRFAVLRMR
jgi:hypothetical protein